MEAGLFVSEVGCKTNLKELSALKIFDTFFNDTSYFWNIRCDNSNASLHLCANAKCDLIPKKLEI